MVGGKRGEAVAAQVKQERVLMRGQLHKLEVEGKSEAIVTAESPVQAGSWSGSGKISFTQDGARTADLRRGGLVPRHLWMSRLAGVVYA